MPSAPRKQRLKEEVTIVPDGDAWEILELSTGEIELEPSDATEEVELPTVVGFAQKSHGALYRLDDATVLTPTPEAASAPSSLRPRPASRPDDTRTQTARSLLHRVADIVPRALKKAIEATGLHRLPTPAAPTAPRTPTWPPELWKRLRTTAFFDGLPNDALRDALASGDLRHVTLERDRLLDTGGALVLVLRGQLGVGAFAAETLRDERKAAQLALSGERGLKQERARRMEVGSLAGLAERNLATFEDGDVLETALGADGHATLAVFSVTPCEAVLIARPRADGLRRVFPFMGDRFRRATAAARARLEATAGARALVADFFIRHGLSVSMTLRVRKIDACIECGACEQACEDRYGAARLRLNGRILGGLDFVDACHTCTDQRCVDPCNYDAIRFDTERREILISEANCTGCTLCATACPYDAIEMHELDDKPLLKLRLEKAGALAWGEGTPRKARLRRIASKCDHCAFHSDQACISACPTGALIEVHPSDVVEQMPAEARQTARAGHDRTSVIDVGALNSPAAFTAGPSVPVLGRARAQRVRMLMGLWWTLGLVAVAAGALEILLRQAWPELSLGHYLLVHGEGLDAEVALRKVEFRPGCGLAVGFGWAGTAVMFSGMAYVWRRRWRLLRNWGPLRAWFDWHVMTGVVGPAFILMHSAAKLDNWVSLGFWSMIGTVASGLMGRYLSTEVEERAGGAALELLDADRALAALRAQHPGVRVADGWLEGYRRRVAGWERRRLGRRSKLRSDKDAPTSAWGALLTFFWVLRDDVLEGRRLRALARALRTALPGRKRAVTQLRREVLAAARQLARLERRRGLLPLLDPLFSHWKAVHVPMAIALTLIATLHIILV